MLEPKVHFFLKDKGRGIAKKFLLFVCLNFSGFQKGYHEFSRTLLCRKKMKNAKQVSQNFWLLLLRENLLAFSGFGTSVKIFETFQVCTIYNTRLLTVSLNVVNRVGSVIFKKLSTSIVGLFCIK